MLYGGAFDEDFFSRSGPIGVWFATIGMVRYINELEMGELAKVHRELDNITLDLYRLYRSGKIDEAHEGLKIIDKQSERFLSLLLLLENRLKEV